MSNKLGNFKYRAIIMVETIEIIENLPTFMIGNKHDLSDQKAITNEEIDTLKGELNLEYIETSAKTGEHITLIFQKIADFFMDLQNK